jgi:hypothetical protein
VFGWNKSTRKELEDLSALLNDVRVYRQPALMHIMAVQQWLETLIANMDDFQEQVAEF